MHPTIQKPLLTICTALAVAILGTTGVQATNLINSHNGRLDSTPPGTELADVKLECVKSTGGGGELIETCDKTYFALDQHEMILQGRGPNQSFVDETVFNMTGVAWTDYHLDFLGFDSFSVDASNILCTAGSGMDCATTMQMNDSFWIFFNDPAFPGFNDDVLNLIITVVGPGTIVQYPTFDIPEPGTLALFGLGLAGLGFARRKKRV